MLNPTNSRPAGNRAANVKAATSTASSITVTGRLTLDLRGFVDDQGWLPDVVRAEMVWADVPDGVALLVDIGRAQVWPAWVWSPLAEPTAPRFSRIDVRGTGNVGLAVRDIRAALEARDG